MWCLFPQPDDADEDDMTDAMADSMFPDPLSKARREALMKVDYVLDTCIAMMTTFPTQWEEQTVTMTVQYSLLLFPDFPVVRPQWQRHH